jgi:hypothetical protein
MPKLKKCKYKNIECFVMNEHEDGSLTIVTDRSSFANSDGGWTRVDKFEWKKTVTAGEITIVDRQEPV